MREEEPEEVSEGAPAWMATFADLATLLLTFFVLLLSFANMDVRDFRAALGSVKDAFGVKNLHPGDLPALATSPVELSDRESTSTIPVVEEPIVERFERLIEARGLDKHVEVTAAPGGVVVRVRSTALFGAGAADLGPESAPVLALIAELRKLHDGDLIVTGHTDNVPIRTPRYPSNWELSSARAGAAMRRLVEEHGLDARRIRVAGYGPVRPLESNATAEGRAKNRRVEFMFVQTPDEQTADASGTLAATI